MFTFINRHKTKICGIVLAGLGALQANSQMMQSVLSQKDFAYVSMALGFLVAVIGFINTSQGN